MMMGSWEELSGRARLARKLVNCGVLLLIGAVSTARAAERDVLVSSRFSNNVLRYDGVTGAFVGVFASGHGLANPNGVAYGPDGNLYIGLGDDAKVMRFNGLTGAYIDDFVPAGSGGLGGVRDIAFGLDGDLYVNSGTTDKVLRYDGDTGSFVGVAAEGHGMRGPVGLTVGSNGDLFIGAALSNTIYQFTTSGAFVRSFTTGGSHRQATGVAFGTDGLLYVAESVTNEVMRLDVGTGVFSGPFATTGLSTPIYMTFGPDGSLLTGSFGNDSVARFDPVTGASLGTFIASGSGGLDGTHDIVFMPVPGPSSVVMAGMAIAACQRRRRCTRRAAAYCRGLGPD